MEGYSNHIRSFIPVDDSLNLNISDVLVSEILRSCRTHIRKDFFEDIITPQLKKATFFVGDRAPQKFLKWLCELNLYKLNILDQY